MLKRKLTELSNAPTALTKTKVPVPAIVLALGIVIVTANLDWLRSLELLTCPLLLIWFCARELK
jgi:ABC-type Fe3+ transport system permease subunit